ncbi:7318_t:CDS:2 [Diversispora eburnea]|uniref:7318_t:CDS:1 n=1 Tax=Diversispora eburnea TaxID=1213867 RepID=A0A9N9A3A7_9GLOM|nr:7318_t:CDS:2 [Diversispora eburnea]
MDHQKSATSSGIRAKKLQSPIFIYHSTNIKMSLVDEIGSQRHLKKMGSYVSSVADIIVYQPIFSWENIIKRFIDDEEYNLFNKCLEIPFLIERIEKYTDKTTQQFQLDRNNIKQHIYLHAEMNILTSMVNHEDKNRVIGVSKRCCYLCELYIDFAQKEGYNIIISGTHKKIYHGWKLPYLTDNDFQPKSLKSIMENLDRIIENKIKHYTSNLLAASDSSAEKIVMN